MIPDSVQLPQPQVDWSSITRNLSIEPHQTLVIMNEIKPTLEAHRTLDAAPPATPQDATRPQGVPQRHRFPLSTSPPYTSSPHHKTPLTPAPSAPTSPVTTRLLPPSTQSHTPPCSCSSSLLPTNSTNTHTRIPRQQE
ncbi:hypothetical protein HU200_008639 [Digitaria exilis]|uniref:Uncharacterized protein n=1 Tax=Digitaria exilis TaxID=1010633 RepID=A0A835FLK6_9POAL|nr:hypothetical protein HU200_008639 [Digitaria exilis]CAB3447428.1 unnamed protein product [Digitaria exilis]